VLGVQTTDLALNLASATGTADALNLTLSNQDAADLTIAALSITGVETLNVTSTFTPATPSVGTFKNVITTLAGTNNTALQTVTLAGASEVSVTTGALNQSFVINASAATGKTTIASLGQTVAVSATTNKGLIVAYQAGNAYVYSAVEGADGDANLAAADIALVGVLNGVAVGTLVAGNFTLIA
jgi:hypothetical protein